MKSIENEICVCLAKSNPIETIRQHTDKLISAADKLWKLKYINDETYRLLKIACEYHDYGKVNEKFQNRITKGENFNIKNEIPHGILSMVFLKKDMFNSDDEYYRVSACVMLHHRIRENMLLQYLRENIECIKNFAREYIEQIDIRKYKNKELIRIINSTNEVETIRLKGLLHKCDYTASAGIEVEYENDFLLKKMEQLGYEWRRVQKYCSEHRKDNLIVVAPTGMGKTEAGLLWIGNNKGFFVLPLKTAINAMYERIANSILNNDNIENRLALLHGGMKMYYISKIDESNINLNEYIQYSQKMSLPITISTMDQLFDFVFKGFAYEYKLAQLAYSKIVIDEIQVYDATLTAFLIYGIEKIHKLGGKIAIITATLPPYVRKEIERALDGNCLYKSFTEDGKVRHNVKVLDKEINTEDIIKKYNELNNRNESSKILVICNSVEVAQNLYGELKEYNVKLVHSKFIKKDRKKLEEQIIECGKTYSNTERKIIDKKSEIWISTSMVEASLDIDFDYLFTELNNLFALFQRMGRCNRKAVKDIYKKDYNCFVYTKPLGKVKKYLKNTDVFETSIKAIQNLEGIVSEKEKEKLINDYMTRENMNSYYEKYEKVMECLRNNEGDDNSKRKIREIASVEVIPKLIYDKYSEKIEKLFKKLENENDFIEREKEMANIKEYCLSICEYECDKNDIVFKKYINKYFEIPILNCEYSEDMGFIKNSVKSKGIEEKRLDAGGIFIE